MTELTTLNSAESPRANQKTGFRLSWVLYILAGLIVLSLIAFVTFQPIQVLPRITLGPGYALTDQNNLRLTNEDVRGTLVLYSITHTACATPCIQTNQVMQEVQSRLGEVDSGGIPIKLVTMTVNPTHDTPETLNAFAQKMGAEPDVWHFVTGPLERMRWIIGGGFGVYFDQKEDGSVAFDPAFMLIDGNGILRAEYKTAKPNVDTILRDFGLIAEEAQNSNGSSRYAYEAAHLFLCYPRG